VAGKFDQNWNLSPLAVTVGINLHNYTPANLDSASILWITPTATIDFSGLGGGQERRLMFIGLRQAGAFNVNILAENGGSLAQNRFADAVVMNMNGAGIVVSAWIYLGSRWRRWKF
jgi:hypothetical protein